jgi:hypothetical protein
VKVAGQAETLVKAGNGVDVAEASVEALRAR